MRNRTGNFTKIATDLKGLIQNSPSKATRAISGPTEQNSKMGEFKEVEKLLDLEEYLTEIQKEKGDLENRIEIVDKEEENSVEKLKKEQKQDVKSLQVRRKKLMSNIKEIS